MVRRGQMNLSKALQLLTLILLIILASFVGAQDEELGYEFEYEDEDFHAQRIGLSLTTRNWYLINGEAGSERSGIADTGASTFIRDEFEFGTDDSIYCMLELRYEHWWWDHSFISPNVFLAYNPGIHDGADMRFFASLVDDPDTLAATTIKGDTEGYDFETGFNLGFGFGFREGISLEIGPGFFYRNSCIEVDDVKFVDTFTSGNGSVDENFGAIYGSFVDYSVEYLAFVLDFTLRFPIEPSKRVWIKLYARMFPFTFVENEIDFGDVRLEQFGWDTANAWQLEGTLMVYLYRSRQWAWRLDAGYRYFIWKSDENMKEDFIPNVGVALQDEPIVDFIKASEHGPFVGFSVEF